MKVWHAVEVEISRAAETAVTTQLWASGTTGIEYSEDSSDFITLRAYFENAPDLEKIRELIDLPEAMLRGIRNLTVADQDWLAEWKKGYEPIEIGQRLTITPSWKCDQVRPSTRTLIEIDPGMAFGAGTHETTRGCLEMLEKYWRGGALLDAGTGTGILAIAAIKLAPNSKVIGFDIDPEAITVAEENAAINGVSDAIELEVNTCSSYHGQSFDLVTANLTADVIVPLAADFAQVVKPGGILIVSGILREQSGEVRSALESRTFTLIETRPDGEWVTFGFQMS